SPRDYSSLSAQSPAPIPTNSHYVSDLELFGLRVRRAAAVARPVREQGCRLPFPGLLDGRASRCFREYTQRLAPPSLWTQSGSTLASCSYSGRCFTTFVHSLSSLHCQSRIVVAPIALRPPRKHARAQF